MPPQPSHFLAESKHLLSEVELLCQFERAGDAISIKSLRRQRTRAVNARALAPCAQDLLNSS